MDCPSQCRKYQEKKQAKVSDLDRIYFTIRDQRFPEISNKGSAALALMISLARIDKSGISAPIGAIAKTINRNGYHMSERTLYRALSELQKHGFFIRSKYRVGHDKFETKIVFIEERFKFWTQKVIKQPTQEHISSYLPNCQEPLRTKTDHRVNTPNSTKDIYKPRVRASNFKNWRHPVLYSLLCVMLKTKNRDRALILSRARLEIEAERSGVTLAGRSGVDWNRPSWQDMPFYQREKIVSEEILPLLCDKSTLTPRGDGDLLSEITEALCAPDFSLDCDRRESSVQIQTVQPAVLPAPPPPSCLDSDELRILQEAASRHKQRATGC